MRYCTFVILGHVWLDFVVKIYVSSWGRFVDGIFLFSSLEVVDGLVDIFLTLNHYKNSFVVVW